MTGSPGLRVHVSLFTYFFTSWLKEKLEDHPAFNLGPIHVYWVISCFVVFCKMHHLCHVFKVSASRTQRNILCLGLTLKESTESRLTEQEQMESQQIQKKGKLSGRKTCGREREGKA